MKNSRDLRRSVQDRYAGIAREASRSCCEPAAPGSCGSEASAQPATLSLGCGDPTSLARLQPGEVALDLGSGAGLDVLAAARLVGPRGKVFGLDMTPEMLALARSNLAAAGLTNVELLEGAIESIPLDDRTVDVVLSNCVINLSTDKRAALREAFRVLRPGGRLAVADIVALEPLAESVRGDERAWSSCVSGALEIDEYRALLAEAGFEEVSIEPLETSACAEPTSESSCCGSSSPAPVRSANVRARKSHSS